jgi:hypothetical protein
VTQARLLLGWSTADLSQRDPKKVEARHLLILALLLGLLAASSSGALSDGAQARERTVERPRALVERVEKPRHA